MTRATIAGGTFLFGLVLLALGYWAFQHGDVAAITSSAIQPSIMPEVTEAHPAGGTHQGFLYGRITTVDDGSYVGRLRWGRGEEAFWSDYFNGFKDENPWATHAPPERLKEQQPLKVFGVEIVQRESEIDLGRPFMARFGDIAQIESRGLDVRVTLKSETAFDLDRRAAGDFDDGVRVWDEKRGTVDLGPRSIRTIEFLPNTLPGSAPYRLQGTVRTPQGDFSGFVQWNREKCVGSDVLKGRNARSELSLRFDTIDSIARRSNDSSLVTLLDGREIVLAGTRDAGHENRGIYVDDRRYGRVLISWDAFERVDFSRGGSGPAYGEFPPGRPLGGSVTTRSGDHYTGRLVFDLDESETHETLDAPAEGVDYTVPFGLIASIVLPGREERGSQPNSVTLHDGEVLQLEGAGDLGGGNAGMLIFIEGRPLPMYVPWDDIERVDFDRSG